MNTPPELGLDHHLASPALTPEESQGLSPKSQPHPATTTIFRTLSTYPFDQDSDFQAGLSSILQNPNPDSNDNELILQAKCFYFAKKYSLPPISPPIYQAWLSSLTQPRPQPQALSKYPDPSASNTSTNPTYPSNFTHLVDLITSGAPIPGIEEIPPTVLDASASLSTPEANAARRKPWESEVDGSATAAEDRREEEGEGVVGILRPLNSAITATAVIATATGVGEGGRAEKPKLEDAMGE